MRAEVRAERVCELCVRCRCVRAYFDLRCAIALFILVDRGADEYVNRIYVPLHTILIYGLHIRLPPYQPGSKVPMEE